MFYDKINLKSVAATESGIGKALTEKKKEKAYEREDTAEIWGSFGDTTGVKTYFAPGRVNLIGGAYGYNGGHVFPLCADYRDYGAARQRADRKLRFIL